MKERENLINGPEESYYTGIDPVREVYHRLPLVTSRREVEMGYGQEKDYRVR